MTTCIFDGLLRALRQPGRCEMESLLAGIFIANRLFMIDLMTMISVVNVYVMACPCSSSEV